MRNQTEDGAVSQRWPQLEATPTLGMEGQSKDGALRPWPADDPRRHDPWIGWLVLWQLKPWRGFSPRTARHAIHSREEKQKYLTSLFPSSFNLSSTPTIGATQPSWRPADIGAWKVQPAGSDIWNTE